MTALDSLGIARFYPPENFRSPFESQDVRSSRFMRAILKALLEIIRFRFRSRVSLELEVVALRHQVRLMRSSRRTIFRVPERERLVWILLYRLWPRVSKFMLVVKPRTVVRWHREGFCFYWRWKTRLKPGVKPRLDIRDLALRIRAENPLWGVKRIHAEIAKLGIHVSWQTIYRYLRSTGASWPTPPSWKTFLRNHMHETVAADMLVVITKTYRLLYVLVFLELKRRRIAHFNVTYHPTQEWLADQLSEAFGANPLRKNLRPRFLIRDRDRSYGKVFRERLASLGIADCMTSYKSPWQNIYVERVIQTIRHECLNHVVALSERHVRGILREYVTYYNESRLHLSLDYDAPEYRRTQRPYLGKKIVGIPQVGGLHHRYERRAA